MSKPKRYWMMKSEPDAFGIDDLEIQIQRLWQLHEADPELIILPAHDRRQWDVVFDGGDCVR